MQLVGYGIVVAITFSILLVLPLRWFNPPATAFLLRDEQAQVAHLQDYWTPINAIAPSAAIAVIAAEDQKFPHHYGFDFESLRKALVEKRKRARGASTITQQLAKNLYLWPGRSLFRKGIEAYFALLIELFLPKKRILEIYLNVVEFGEGVYGVGYASQMFFKKLPANLNRWESALLAAVLPNPKKLSAQMPSNYVQQRATDINASVRALGGVSYLPWL